MTRIETSRVPLREIWPARRPIVGMVHLLPLPGAPEWDGSLERVRDRALADAHALVDAGCNGLLVENFGDATFFPDRVPPETVAAMAVIAAGIRALPVPLGINVLRNDAEAALAIAAAVGAAFIRVNVHTFALLTDQGWIGGRAHHTLRMRKGLGLRCAILADIAVKHAVLPTGLDPAEVARDTWHRGLADGLVASGRATGEAPSALRIRALRDAVPEAPVWIGSGVDATNAAALGPLADGIIVGSAVQQDGVAGRGVDRDRALRVIQAVRATDRPGGTPN